MVENLSLSIVIIHLGLPKLYILVYTYCPSIINSAPFHSQEYPGLDDKLDGHPIYRPHSLDDGVLGKQAIRIAWWIITQYPGLLVALNRALQDSAPMPYAIP